MPKSISTEIDKENDYLMQGRKLKYVFLVQGEGRGHMTQAITLSTILHRAGHDIEHVFIGNNSKRMVPHFFHQKIKATNVELLSSPGFITDSKSKGIRIRATIVHGLLNLHHYLKSCWKLNNVVTQIRPDIIINFYDPLGGLYNFIFRPKLTYLCIGHQYLAHHQDFRFASGTLDKWLFLLNNKLTAIGAKKELALSFTPYRRPKNPKLRVFPPLLRADIKNCKISDEGYLLVYLLNKGYSEELLEWHRLNSEIKIHCFWDNQDVSDEYSPHPNLTFHLLNDYKFLEYMAGCSGYVSTAGFESICEAMYFSKPVMVVPVEGHYEQLCNVLDALGAGTGISSKTFDLTRFVQFLRYFEADHYKFRQWVADADYQFLSAIVTAYEKSKVRKDKPLGQPHPVLPQHAH